MSSVRLSQTCTGALALAFFIGCNAVFGFQEGKPFPPDPSMDGGDGATVDSSSACIGETCSTPPPNSCRDSTHLEAFDTVGTCSGGTCRYHSQLVMCACSGGVCNDDPCASVSC